MNQKSHQASPKTLPFKRQKFLSKIEEINDLTPTVKEFILSTPSEFDFMAGQFISIKFPLPPPNSRIIGRAYSIASAPDLKNKLELCIKLVEGGKVTPLLFENPPAEINVMGPMGHFYLTPEDKEKKIVFIATGTGIAPFKSMLEDLLLAKGHKGGLTLLSGVRYEEEELYPHIWSNFLKRFPNFTYQSAISRPKAHDFPGITGRVTDLLPNHITQNNDQLFIICGLKEMVESVKKILTDHGVTEDSIRFEKYD